MTSHDSSFRETPTRARMGAFPGLDGASLDSRSIRARSSAVERNRSSSFVRSFFSFVRSFFSFVRSFVRTASSLSRARHVVEVLAVSSAGIARDAAR